VAILVSSGSKMNLDVLFGSLAVIKLITTPLLGFLQNIYVFTNGLASMERIHHHTQKDELFNKHMPDCLDRSNRPQAESTSPHFEVRHLEDNLAMFQNASFSIQPGNPLLHDLTFTLVPGTLNLVLGQVGSGKSLLLRSLLEEMICERGQAQHLKLGVSFCSQHPWLRNVTIRENIIGNSKFDPAWYLKVLWVCALDQDIKMIEKEDLARVGSNGATLSGGQKNRISLARALYSRTPVLICDDILAGLDKITEKRVFDRVFGPSGMLRQAKSTVVLATHSTHFSAEADQLLIMSNGTLTHSKNQASSSIATRDTQNSTATPGDLVQTGGQNGKDEKDENSYALKDIKNCTTAKNPDSEPLKLTVRSEERKALAHYLASVGSINLIIFFTLFLLSHGGVSVQCEYYYHDLHSLFLQCVDIWLKLWFQIPNRTRESNIQYTWIFGIITVANIILMCGFIL
jgi:ATP-binding cassette subfamily C (CFTR/MRP) protein 1